MTFNNNLNNYSDGVSTGGSGGGRGGGGGGNILVALLASSIGRKFGIPGMIIAAVVVFFFSGGSNMIGGGDNASQQGEQLQGCETKEDANSRDECRIAATKKSLDDYWGEALPANANIDYSKPQVHIAEGRISTGCGAANISQSGPFYCPSDKTVYLSTGFYEQLNKMGGSDGPFAQEYVTAHEFGHHIQNLQGNLGLSDYNDPGEDSNAVKMELQADCYAGLWASHADKGDNALLEPITQDQVQQAITTAQSIGDDAIQESAGQEVNPDSWTHGSSEQRQESFLRGYQGGTMESCHEDFRR